MIKYFDHELEECSRVLIHDISYKCKLCGLICFYYIPGNYHWKYSDGLGWGNNVRACEMLTITCEEEQIKKLLE